LSHVVLTSYFEAKILYLPAIIKTIVPCPKAIPGTENLLTNFSLSVWLKIALVLLVTTAVFRCAGNGHYRSVRNEAYTYQSLSSCFHNAWSILVAVSVPQQPTNSSLRVFFLLYVCFCFAISTVFQTFFVSYLVEEKYEKKIETLDELLNSDVIYGYFPALHFAFSTLWYAEFVTFFESKEPKEDCSDMRKCVERMITKSNVAIINEPVLATYIAKELGSVDVRKLFCSQDDPNFNNWIHVFKKGIPLLGMFNIPLSRYLEAGFLERLWAEL